MEEDKAPIGMVILFRLMDPISFKVEKNHPNPRPTSLVVGISQVMNTSALEPQLSRKLLPESNLDLTMILSLSNTTSIIYPQTNPYELTSLQFLEETMILTELHSNSDWELDLSLT